MTKYLKFFSLLVVTAAISLWFGSCSQNKSDMQNEINHLNISERKVSGRIILTLGDSNGVMNGGWPTQLEAELTGDRILNNSEGGRTIGFDNCGLPEWNALRNIRTYLEWGLNRSGNQAIDEVIILLGTNDSKACFDDQKDEVAPNLIKLIEKIHDFDNAGNPPPYITIVTPPPYAPDSLTVKDALGGDFRVRLLLSQFLDVAIRYHCAYVNIYPLIKSRFQDLVEDHVHLTREGHSIVAKAIAEVLNDREAPEPPSHVLWNDNIFSWSPSTSDDVIGYDIMDGDRIIEAVSDTTIALPYKVTDLSVHARDGYGNVSTTIIP